MNYRYAVIRLPGFNARVVDLGTGLDESQAWDFARAACTPGERVETIEVERARAELVRHMTNEQIARLDERKAQI